MSRDAGGARPDLYDVAIVGYGPVGEVLANLFGRDGFDVVVIEREADMYHLPRAAHFDAEIMRVFQSIGLVDEALPATSLVTAYDFVNAAGEVLLHFGGTDADDPSGYKSDYFFYQPALDAALRGGVERYPNVDVRLGVEVVSLTEVGGAVEVGVGVEVGDAVEVGGAVEVGVRRTGSDDPPEVVRARWVVGCDGGRSFVRKACGIGFDDIGFEEDWLVVDLALRHPVDHLDEVAYQICDPVRPVTQIPMPAPHRRWEFMLVDGETREQVERPEKVAELVAPWLAPDEYELIRAVVYTFHALLATGWRKERVLIAGDAAHQMPPFLGQGMCSGIRDAVNLHWKLALVLRGRADASLLDTYEPERSPHVKAIIDMAVTMGGVICTTDPEVAAARDAALLGGGGAAFADQGTDRFPPLGPGLLRSGPNGTPVEGAGRQIPQPWVTDASGAVVRLDDVLGPGFAAIRRDGDHLRVLTGLESGLVGSAGESPVGGGSGGGESETGVDGVSVSVDAAGVSGPLDRQGTDGWEAALVVADPSGGLTGWLDKAGAAAVIVRPDRYVYALLESSDELPDALADLRTALRGG